MEIQQILMLLIYTFVFSYIFNVRWGVEQTGSKIQFALILYIGLIAHGMIAEVLNAAPNIIFNNSNYVKKVIFPLEILPVVSLGVALFHGLTSFIVLLIALLLTEGTFNWTIIFVPLIITPFLFIILGLALMLSSFGLFLRDIGQLIGVLVVALLFLCPIFYPISSIPDELQTAILINPLSLIVEELRQVVIFGNLPNFMALSIYSLVSFVICWIGFIWFQKTRETFADVL